MRLAIFIGGYLPAKKYGGPVTSVANLVENLGNEIEIYIISNNHDLDETKVLDGISPGWNQVGNAKIIYIYDKEYTKKRFIDILEDCKPDLVYLSSIFFYQMNIPAIRAAKSLSLPIIIAPRGELCANALELGRKKKFFYLAVLKATGLFKGLNYHTTSKEEYNATRDILCVNEERIWLFPNMPCKPSNSKKLEKQSGEAKFVFISRIQEKKNLLYAIDLVGKIAGKVSFDIYGPLEQKEYWTKCEEAIKKAQPNVRIEYKGALEPGASREVFSKYHCFLFPTLSENYGHVIAEAISSGCLLILSKETTPWDDVEGNGGWICTLDDDQQWINALELIVQMDEDKYTEYVYKLSQYTVKKLAISELKQKYLNMFENCILGGV